MQDYVVSLNCEVGRSFKCQKAADSVALDVNEKSRHTLSVSADLTTPFNIGLIVGSSGSGKTTLAKKIWGAECMSEVLKLDSPVIDQFPESMTYEDAAKCLTGMGLTSIPCWIRPAGTLSTGQKARAEAALQLQMTREVVVVDEWTSTVDRTVAKVMSHSIQKHARHHKKTIILVACHRDIIEWLNPDWVIDCNTQTFENRRSMVGAFERTDRLRLDIRPCDRKSWKYFSKYHYLSDKLPGGKLYTFGLFQGDDQIGFQCFANYSFVDRQLYHSNRVVIHPDYVGLGLGLRMTTAASHEMVRMGFKIKAKFTSIAMAKARKNHPNWKCIDVVRHITTASNGAIGKLKTGKSQADVKSFEGRQASKLQRVTYYYYDFVPDRQS